MEENSELFDPSIEDQKIIDQIESLSKKRHDILHNFVSQELKVPFGEIPVNKSLELNLSSNDYEIITKSSEWSLVQNQSPDILIIDKEKNEVKIIDVTIASEYFAIKFKKSKYDLLKRQFVLINYKAEVYPLVYNPITGLMSGFTQVGINIVPVEISRTIDTLTNELQQLLSTSVGRQWRIGSLETLKLREQITYEKERLLSDIKDHTVLPFNGTNDLIQMIDGKIEEVDTEQFIQETLSYEKTLKFKLTAKTSCDIEKFWAFHKYHSCTKFLDDIKIGKEEYAKMMLEQNKLFRSYLPLPNLDGVKLLFHDRRTTQDDGDKVKILLSYCKESDDIFVKAMSTKSQVISDKLAEKMNVVDNKECYRTIKWTREEMYHISLEGPNRRRFTRTSKEHQKMSNKNTNYWIDPDTDVSEIKTLSFRYSRISNPEDTPDKWRGPGLDYLRACQEIYREININSIRKIINKSYIIKPTKIEGLYVMLFKGPQLRNAETSSIIWFKIVLIPEINNLNQNQLVINSHWKKWYPNSKCWSSRWLSVDSNRLDHYLRCYDRVLMSYLSYINTSDKTLHESVITDSSNTLGLIIMIYLEDKRSTSKMLQDVRYLFMNKMSIYDYSGKTMERFESPIRTPLQLYLLKKIIDYFAVSKFRDIVTNMIVGHYDYSPGAVKINDKFSGMNLSIKRILTDGPDINFDQILHEMYFCMLFNKNQDDPTHASFQILTKILEGEKNYQEIKSTTKLHNGYLVDWKSDLKEILLTDKRNQFSRYAIMVGSRLQSISKYNGTFQSGSAHVYASKHSSINKTLDKFSTFKSSSMLDRKVYSTNLSENNSRMRIDQENRLKKENKMDWEINELYVDDYDIKEDNNYELGARTTKQNRRRRCVQGCLELINKGCYNSFQTALLCVKNTEYFQVFKKNQIGGVREILILNIEDRITINILETFSKLICSKDSREMLTHGPIKTKCYHEMIRRVRLRNTETKLFHLNFDKSKWGPSFQPIQFIYMFYPYKDKYPDLFNLLLAILIKHSNKKAILPERLVRAWVKDPDNIFKHEMDENLQKLKEEFLNTKILVFNNESNMGQGILHFTSSLLHLCLISFRDELYEKWLKKEHIQDKPYWEDILSSDDSFTCFNSNTKTAQEAKKVLDGFLNCQEMSERLFNCETSRAKSSVSNIVCEFNSLFGSNLGFHPTRLKFALASMDVFYTDSYYRMVKESFNVCQSLFENGSSLELFTIAHKLNKDFCDHIYGTNEFETDPRQILNCQRIPYQLGQYPIQHPVLMLLFGPEAHNYQIIGDWNKLTFSEKTVFLQAHSSTKTVDLNLLSDPRTHDDIYGGLHRIQTKIRPSLLISALRRMAPFGPEQIREFIQSNPLFLIRPAETFDEVKMKISMYLFLDNAAESARAINPAFFYGRMSAIKNAKIFYIPTISKKTTTYRESIEWFLENKQSTVGFDDIQYLYPHLEKFNRLVRFISQDTDELNPRNLLEAKRFITLMTKEVSFKLNHTISDILFHLWEKPRLETSFDRDASTLMEFYPFIKGTLADTLSGLSRIRPEAVQKLALLLMRMMGSRERPLKIINYGDSSDDIDGTIISLLSNNKYEDRSSKYNMTSDVLTEGLSKFEEIKLLSNLSYMFLETCNSENIKNPDFLSKIDDKSLYSFMKNTAIPFVQKKIIFFLLLTSKRASDLIELTKSTNFMISEYLVEQPMDRNGNYFGEGVVKVQTGSTVLILDTEKRMIKTTNLDINNTHRLIIESMRLLGKTAKDIEVEHGNFQLTIDKLVEGKGNIHIHFEEIPKVNMLPGNIKKTKKGFVLMDRLTNRMIMSIKQYFMFTNSVSYDSKTEFIYRGISTKALIKNRFFSTSFHMDNMDRDTIIDSIDFKQLIKNPIRLSQMTDITKRNLNLEIIEEEEEKETSAFTSDDLLAHMRDLGYVVDESMLENTDSYLIEEDPPDNYGVEINEESKNETSGQTEDLTDLEKNLDYYNIETNDMFQISLEGNQSRFKTMRDVKMSEVIMNRVSHCAEIILTHCMFNVNGICRSSLYDISERLSSSPFLESLQNSFIYVYNDLFGNLEAMEEPDYITIIITKKFINKLQTSEKPKLRIKTRRF